MEYTMFSDPDDFERAVGINFGKLSTGKNGRFTQKLLKYNKEWGQYARNL